MANSHQNKSKNWFSKFGGRRNQSPYQPVDYSSTSNNAADLSKPSETARLSAQALLRKVAQNYKPAVPKNTASKPSFSYTPPTPQNVKQEASALKEAIRALLPSYAERNMNPSFTQNSPLPHAGEPAPRYPAHLIDEIGKQGEKVLSNGGAVLGNILNQNVFSPVAEPLDDAHVRTQRAQAAFDRRRKSRDLLRDIRR